MTEDPQTPQDDETPEPAGGDVAEPEQSADPSEAPATDAGDDAPTGAEQPDADEGVEAHPAAAGPSAEGAGEADDAAAPAETEAAQEAPAAAADDAEAAPSGDADAAPEAEAQQERPRPKPRKRDRDEDDKPEVVPGAHLEPDLVLERDSGSDQDEYSQYADTYGGAEDDDSPEAAEAPVEAPVERKVLDLAADARYQATGKRKTAVARVILKPGTGTYTINGKPLEVFFPRAGLQLQAKQPLETAGYEARMDVVAKIHGGGVSSQAGALRHGIARALTEADPALRTELKRKGFLTRDARVKERKKAGLKKARKRPQFSKR
jgi:small subunit ribosomal protein S9